MKLLQIEISESSLPVRVTVSGEIDLSTVDELGERIDSVSGHGAGTIVVDLSGVTFMDSSGLRLMLRVHERMTANGDRLVIAGSSRRIARVFELTGAHETLEIVDEA